VLGYAEVSYIKYKQAYLNVITEHAAVESMLCSTAILQPPWLYPRDREIPEKIGRSPEVHTQQFLITYI
jgi:hypothetical protein